MLLSMKNAQSNVIIGKVTGTRNERNAACNIATSTVATD